MEKKVFEIISSVKGCQFANITYISEGGIPQKVIGKGNVVTKIVKTNCQINFSYENAVNNRLSKIGEEKSFVAQSLPWGNWIEGQENKLIEHKGNLYLRYYDVKNADISSLWLVNGKIATAEQFAKIINYLQSKKNTIKTQTEKGLTENQVKPKVIKASNIIRLAINGEEITQVNEYAEAFAK